MLGWKEGGIRWKVVFNSEKVVITQVLLLYSHNKYMVNYTCISCLWIARDVEEHLLSLVFYTIKEKEEEGSRLSSRANFIGEIYSILNVCTSI